MMCSSFVNWKRGYITLITGLAMVLVFTACSDKTKVPSGVLDREAMEAVMWDMILADRYAITYFPTDTIKRKDIKTETLKLYDQVFQLHDISQEEFLKSYKFYLSRPDLSKVIFDSIYTRANRRRDQEMQERQREQQKQDSLLNLQLKDSSAIKLRADSIAAKLKADSIAGKRKLDSLATILRKDSTRTKLKFDSLRFKHRRDSVLNRLRSRSLEQRRKTE